MSVLVTGAAGFVGGHLLDLLRERGEGPLYALARHLPDASRQPEGVRWLTTDMRDADAVARSVDEARPSLIYHLAGYASGGASERDLVYAINVSATIHLLAAAAALRQPVRVLLASTGYVYGTCVLGRPATEDSPVRPQGVYAESKAEMERRALDEQWGAEVSVIIARAFNHTGPGQTSAFAVPAFARQLAAIEAGLSEPELHVGNLDTWRDFADVRDVARAYVALIAEGGHGECFNVCTGRAVRMSDVVAQLVAMCRADVAVRPDPERMRPSDVPVNYGLARRLESRTGWRSEIPLAQTLSDTLGWWRLDPARS